MCGDQLVDQRDEDAISLKGDYEFKQNKNREMGREKRKNRQ